MNTMKFSQMLTDSAAIYEYKNIDEFCQKLSDNDFELIHTGKKEKIDYYNIPASFDIETSSFYEGKEKRATMYIWQLGIAGYCIYGRTWSEFDDTMERIKETLKLSDKKYMPIYVHNLSYEFQWIMKRMSFSDVFALENRKVLRAKTTDGFEFRCSYLLSGLSLAKVGENLLKYKCNKMVGDLDYDLVRHSGTPLSDKELGYCINDIRVVMAFVQEEIENNGDITKIPMTKTGYVRNFCREFFLHEGDKNHSGKSSKEAKKYRDLIKSLTMAPDEYEQLKRGFQGGFTHADASKCGRTYKDIDSMDFTSSYPAVMLSEKFPMSSGTLIKYPTVEQFNYYKKYFCCIFDCKFNNIQLINLQDAPIGASHCWNIKKPIIDNGKIFYAETLTTTITEQDFYIYQKFYKWDTIQVANLRFYTKGYLPKNFILAIIDLYKAKNELKDVEGKEQEYQLKKGMLNSCYGMAVTDPVRDIIEFDISKGEWKEAKKNDTNKMIEQYNKSKKRFLFYPWGIWVTAYARRNLFSGIYSLGDDYIYSDTDSVKFQNYENHKEYFEKYNTWIEKRLFAMCDFYGIDHDEIRPKTIKGKEKMLGVWDYDGHYDRFKTLGAKRYLVETNGKYKLTVSGLNKKTAIEYMKEQGDPFEFFEEGMKIDGEHTGKLTHFYIDDETSGIVEDYEGNPMQYHELSSIHMEKAEYNLDMHGFIDFINFIRGYRERI